MSVLAVLLSAVIVVGRTVAMAALRNRCFGAGFERAQTLLARGNLVLDVGRTSAARVAEKVEAVVLDISGVDTRPITRPADALEAAVARDPFADGIAKHTLIWFLEAAPSTAQSAAFITHNAGRDRFVVDGAEMSLTFPAGGLPGSKLTPAVVKRHLGVVGTARNLTTVAKVMACARTMERD